nr:DUF1508 domain-containing protein [Comamonas jiangduensis]
MAAKYVLKKAKNGKFFFNLQASNGQPILTSEMYDAVQNALDGVASVRKNGVVETNLDKPSSRPATGTISCRFTKTVKWPSCTPRATLIAM